MKHVLILIICTLLSGGILCASTTPLSANLMAEPAIASQVAWPMTLAPGDPLRLQAGDSAPAPLCAPGHHCDIQQLKLQASDGAPQPLCAPGYHCDIQQERPLMAL